MTQQYAPGRIRILLAADGARQIVMHDDSGVEYIRADIATEWRMGRDAAKRCADAAKASANHIHDQAKALHAECNPDALDEQRDLNEQLTNELEQVKQDRARWYDCAKYWYGEYDKIAPPASGADKRG